jgi:hypothetical protein
MQVYIEKWLQIIERCTGVMPPCPGPVVLNRLDSLFLELQRPFAACKTAGRRNFLNYNYVFCRLFQKMNCTKFCMFFPLIRSKVKLRALDETWGAMASSLGWQVPPLEHVAQFSVRLERPVELLHRLRTKCASVVPALPRTIPMRTGYHTLDHRFGARVPLARPTRRQEPLGQEPHTLALRLKRKRNTPA